MQGAEEDLRKRTSCTSPPPPGESHSGSHKNSDTSVTRNLDLDEPFTILGSYSILGQLHLTSLPSFRENEDDGFGTLSLASFYPDPEGTLLFHRLPMPPVGRIRRARLAALVAAAAAAALWARKNRNGDWKRNLYWFGLVWFWFYNWFV